MSVEFIKAGGELVNISQIARVAWRGTELYLNTSGGYLRVQGTEAAAVWSLLESLLVFDAETGELKHRK